MRSSKSSHEDAEQDQMEKDFLTVVITSPEFFTFVNNVMSAKTDVDIEELTKDFGEDEMKKRKGGYNGKELTYVSSKSLRRRLIDTLGGKYSFIILAEHRVVNPVPFYNKQDEEYVNSSAYIKVLGLLAIPGLGVQVQYGVKKTFGSGESDDWKAAATDAFKKCCAGFGVEATYDDDDSEDHSGGKSGSGKKHEDIEAALEDLEYDEEVYEEALEHEIGWGKYKNLSCGEIFEEDEDYLQWLAVNAREEDDREAALMVLKGKEEEGASKKKKPSSSKSSSKSKQTEKPSSKSTSKAKPSSSAKPANKKKSEKTEEEELIEIIEEVFESDDAYDNVTRTSMIKSVSSSRQHPNGKKKLEELSVKELKKLSEILLEEDE